MKPWLDEVEALTWYLVRVRAGARFVTRGKISPARKVAQRLVAQPATADDQFDAERAPFRIEHLLRQQGFEVFMPRRTVWRWAPGVGGKKRKKVEVPRPLFPGWLFVAMAPGETRWRDLLETPGVLAVAGLHGAPAIVNSRAVRVLAQRFPAGFVRAASAERYMRSRAEFAKGDQVRVADGPLEGMTVEVVAVRGRHAKVLLTMLGTVREVDVDAMLLEAA